MCQPGLPFRAEAFFLLLGENPQRVSMESISKASVGHPVALNKLRPILGGGGWG